MTANSIPKLIDALRPTLPTLAGWVGVSLWTAQTWRQNTYQPKAEKRAALVTAARKHAALLNELADKVEREGKARSGQRLHRGK